MNKDYYLGHPDQMYGVEQFRLVGGKGDGMSVLQIRNRSGLELTVVPDRCLDIYKLRCRAVNLGYFSPAGYVSPEYYDDKGTGFLKNFTGGFLTTCGLSNIGIANTDGEEELPMHGRIGNCPADHVNYQVTETQIVVEAWMNHMQFFGNKLLLKRKLVVLLDENKFYLEDEVFNRGSESEPVMLLYHMNMGYPLLSEHAELRIPSVKVEGRDDYAQADLDHWGKVDEPTSGFREKCYYHYFEGKEGMAAIFNPDIDLGLQISYDTRELGYFTQWNMFGTHEYAMGLEPSNALQEGRESMRRTGKLTELKPGETKTYHVNVKILNSEQEWKALEEKDK